MWPVILGRLVLGAASLVAACSSPCADLKRHAESCGFAPGRWIDERDSVCRRTRAELDGGSAKGEFDAFADCVVTAECSDNEGVARCSSESFPEQSQDPCTRYRLWASACGLEPIGTEEGCGGVGETAGAVAFADWVACITADGCPVPGDQRYDECQAVVPPAMLDLLDACLLLEAYGERCASEADGGVPIPQTSAVECFVQAQVVTAGGSLITAESYLAWAKCLNETQCADITSRSRCYADNLATGLINNDPIEALCEDLFIYAAGQCQNPMIAGGSVDLCLALYGRVTPDSFESYIDCVKNHGCDYIGALQDCSELLAFQ